MHPLIIDLPDGDFSFEIPDNHTISWIPVTRAGALGGTAKGMMMAARARMKNISFVIIDMLILIITAAHLPTASRSIRYSGSPTLAILL